MFWPMLPRSGPRRRRPITAPRMMPTAAPRMTAPGSGRAAKAKCRANRMSASTRPNTMARVITRAKLGPPREVWRNCAPRFVLGPCSRNWPLPITVAASGRTISSSLKPSLRSFAAAASAFSRSEKTANRSRSANRCCCCCCGITTLLKFDVSSQYCVYYRPMWWIMGSGTIVRLPGLRQRFEDGGNFAADVVVVGDLVAHLFPAMHDGGVVAPTKLSADLEPGSIRLFTHDVHGDLARPDDLAVALLAAHESRVDAVVAANSFQHLGDGQVRQRLAVGVEVLKRLHGEADGERGIVQCGIGDDTVERPLQLAHAFALWSGNIFDHRGWDAEAQRLCFGAQDRQPVLVFRRLDIGQQTPLEAGAQAVLQAVDGFWRAITGHHDLLVGIVQRVEGMEKLFLRRFFARDKLDIVYQQDIDLPVFHAEIFGFLIANGVDDLVSELF